MRDRQMGAAIDDPSGSFFLLSPTDSDVIAAIPTRSGWRHIARSMGYNKKARDWLKGWRHATRDHLRWKAALDRGLALGCTAKQMGASE